MKKIFTLTSLMLVAMVGLLQAQRRPVSFRSPKLKENGDATVVRCYTYEAMQAARADNPKAETDAQFEAWMNGEVAKRRAQHRTTTNYTIPVVFHVVSNGEAVGTSPNVSADLIKAQVMMLNRAYNNQDGSRYSVAAPTGLTFALAQKNPTGTVLSEPGIDRINRATKGWTAYGTAGWTQSYIDATVKPGSTWDATKYLNIWLVPVIANGILGYATFPASSGLSGLNSTETANTAGLVIATPTAGSTYTKGTCDNTSDYYTYNMGKTLVHELGHFFGLRHIWGDATCGTDYCNDTPVAEAANYGAPTHPKANNCGTADEMFENYMDYTDDIAMNTFTADQVTRIQTVMQNSPRRNTLPTSPAGFVPVTGTGAVAFITNCIDSIRIPEIGVETNGTIAYFDDTLFVTTDDVAPSAGSLSFTVSGNAIPGQDYQLLTPTINFAPGEATKAVIVRIIDNATIDGTRRIVLTLNPSGGIIAGTSAQTYTIIVDDDDAFKIGQNEVNIINENFDAAAALPTGWNMFASQTGTNRFTVSANGNAGGSGNCLHVTNNLTTKPNSFTKNGGTTYVLGPEIDGLAYESLGNLSLKYRIRGSGTTTAPVHYGYTIANVGGSLYLYGTGGSLTGAGPYCTSSTNPISNSLNLATPGGFGFNKFRFGFYFATTSTTGGGDPGMNVDDVILKATPFKVEDAVTSSFAYTLPQFSTSNIRSFNFKQIISVMDPNGTMNEVKASVSEAGTDRPLIGTEASGTFYRSRKVITLSSPAGLTSPLYSATIYFTQAEIAAWGAEKAAVQIIQVDNPQVLNGPLNPSNAKLIAPSIVTDNLATDGYIAYTFTTTNLGSFAIVSDATALPLKLVSFTGSLKNKATSLKWTTSNEVNTKGFDVMKSTNGGEYQNIGFVKSFNRASNEYTFDDANIEKGNKYYYRLKMSDLDGKFTYSNVVTISYTDKGNWFSVYPSPVKDMLFIQNNAGAVQNASISIADVSGKVLYKHTGNVAGRLEIPVSSWSAGTYVVTIQSNETTTTLKVIKQ